MSLVNDEIPKNKAAYSKTSNLSIEELLYIVNEEIKRIGSTKSKDYKKHRSNKAPSFSTLIKRTEMSWSEILSALGKDLNMPDKTDEELIIDLKKLSKALNRTPSINDLKEAGYSFSLYYYRFGSYNEALKLAGLELNSERVVVTHTNKELMNMYIDLCDKIGRMADANDINECLNYSSDVFMTRFNGIRNLQKLAGYSVNEYKRKYTKQSIIDVLSRAYKIYGRMSNAEITLMSKKIDIFPSVDTICKNFKTTKMSEVWEIIENI